MNTTTINLKIDTALKHDATKIADELGMSLGTLIKVLLKQTIRKQGIQLDTREDIYPPERMTPQMEQLIAEFDEQLHRGTLKTVSHEEFMRGFPVHKDHARDAAS
ncbi:MAG: type II toxin-antitoxin system RelB/DinJ family antitoxin [Candidatus Saccharimonadales bacterium]